MKINFKKGARRIVIVLICICVVCALFCYITSGFIWNTSRFIENTNVFKPDKPENTLSFVDFANQYIKKENDISFNFWDFKCYPYKQYCKFDNNNFYNNKIYEFTIYNLSVYTNDSLLTYRETGKYAIGKIKIKMPTRKQYFSWQLLDFILIFFIAYLIYTLYLFTEFIICWIIRGFKND